MQRKFLEELGLEKETIDKIMTENGNDINSTKQKLEAERDNYKTQLQTAQDALKGFEGVNVDELKGKINELTTSITNKENEYQAKLADVEFSNGLEDALRTAGAKNIKAARAILDIEALKASKNRDSDIKAAIEEAKGKESYLFGSDEPIHNPVLPTNIGGSNTPPKTLTNEELSKLSYEEYKAYRKGE